MSIKYSHAFRHIAKVLFLSIAIATLLLINNPFNDDYPDQINEVSLYFVKNTFEKKIEVSAPEILILGDSLVSRGVDPTGLNNTISLSPWGASPIEMIKILNKSVELFGKPKCLIMGFAYIQQKYREEFFWPMFIKNNFYTKEEFDEIMTKSFKSNSFMTVNEINSLINLKFLIHSELGRFLRFDGLYYMKNKELLRNAMNYTIANKGHSYSYGLPQFEPEWQREMHMQPFKQSPFIDEYLYKLGELIKSYGIKLYYVRPPFYPEINDSEKNHPLIDMQDHIARILYSSGADLKYISKWPKLKQKHFADSLHLNLKGAAIYTRWLNTKIQCE